MTKKLPPLPKEITDQIRYILEKIESGEFRHTQETYHCGSSHCIAGWHAVIVAETLGVKHSERNGSFTHPSVKYDEYDQDNEYDDLFFADECPQEVKDFFLRLEDSCEWGIAAEDWQLTTDEQNLMFNSDADFATQKRLLEYLELGERVNNIRMQETEDPFFRFRRLV